MTWMTIMWPMAIGACVTMGLIQLRVGLRRTPGAAHLLFSLNAIVVAIYSGCELALACADSPVEYLAWLRWLDITAGLQVVTTAAFVWVFFGTGRKWLALLAPGLSCLALIADFLPQPKLVYLQLTGIRKIQTFGGATYTVADGVGNPWNAIFYLGVLLLVVFVADASVTLWRRGSRRRAAVIGGTITFFVLAGGTQAALVDNGIMRTPYLLSFAYLAILVAMGLELSNDVLNAGQLALDLREGERRLALAAEAANLGIWIRDLVRNEIWATDKWRALLGFAKSERIDLDSYLQKLHPEDREAVSQTFTKAVESDGQYETEYRVLLSDGQLRWIASRGRVEFNGAGKPVCVRGVSVDITMRKQAEAESLRQREELAHLSRVMTLSELSGSLAHELNQPLAIILTNAQAAQRLLAQSPPDLAEARDILADIVMEDQRAGEVIRRLRALLKRGETNLQPLSINEVIQDVVRITRSDLIGRGIKLHHACVGHLPRVLGDRIQLQQVLLNLILNACDAMAASPPEGRQLVLATAHRDGTVRVSVSDNGSGLPPDPERVFEPFHTTKKHGLGLGLSICRSIITAHKGRLWAETRGAAGSGATFHIELPAMSEAKP
jgi:PAS domain S-box-containing protein